MVLESRPSSGWTLALVTHLPSAGARRDGSHLIIFLKGSVRLSHQELRQKLLEDDRSTYPRALAL